MKHWHLRKFSIGILSYTGNWYLVPFSSNILCEGRNKVCVCVCVCYSSSIANCSISLNECVVVWGAVYAARKFLYVARLQEETSCNSNAWQSEWGCTVCVWSNFCMNEMLSTAKRILRRKWELLSVKNSDEGSKTTGWLGTAIHDVHKYIIG
jgi:hypothetical protein